MRNAQVTNRAIKAIYASYFAMAIKNVCVLWFFFLWNMQISRPKAKAHIYARSFGQQRRSIRTKKKKNARARTQAHMRKPHRRLRNRLIIYLLVESLQTSHSLFVIILLLFFLVVLFLRCWEKKNIDSWFHRHNHTIMQQSLWIVRSKRTNFLRSLMKSTFV